MSSDNPYQTPFATEHPHGRTRGRRRTRFELFTEIATGFCLVLYFFGVLGSIASLIDPSGTTRVAVAGQLLIVGVLVALGWTSISRKDLNRNVALIMSWISMSPIVGGIAFVAFSVIWQNLSGY